MVGEHWTPTMVEELLAEAASVLDRLPEERIQGHFSAWPEVVRDFWEAFGRHDPVLRRPWPSPAAIDRMYLAIDRLQWLEPQVAKICWLRATGTRWKRICGAVGMSRASAWRHWVMGLAIVAMRLNGSKPPNGKLSCMSRAVELRRSG